MQRLMIFLGFMAFGTWVIYLLAVSGDLVEQESEFSPGQVDVMVMEGVNLRQSQDGLLVLDLWAGRVQMKEESSDTLMEQINFTMYEADEKGESRVSMRGTAQNGVMNQKKKTVVLTGHVELIDGEGREIFSEKVTYNGEKDQLDSPGPVRIISDKSMQQGDSMVYLMKKKQLILTKPMIYQ